MTRDRLSKADTALLRIDDPTNLMMITGVMVLEEPVQYDQLAAVIIQRLLRVDRFRQRVAWPALDAGTPYFEEDPDFDLTHHLRRASLPPGGGKGALQDLVSLLSSTQLDLRRPLWQIHLVDQVDGGCAVIARVHHCLGDGAALAQAILSLTANVPHQSWPKYEPQPQRSPEKRGLKNGLGKAYARSRSNSRKALRLAGQALTLIREPAHLDQVGAYAKDSIAALWRFATFEPDPKTAFCGKLGVPKRVAWSDPLPLDDIKSVRTHLGATVNDVLVAAMTGALRTYLASRGEDVQDLSFRAVVPVNLREPGSEQEMGNRMGAVFIPLPANAGHPVERLHRVNRRMVQAKESMQAPLFRVLISALGAIPTSLANLAVNTFSNRASVIITNVIGPREPQYVAGSVMKAFMAWVPQTGRLSVGVSILTYNDDIYVGVITDEGLVPDPERIIDAYELEIHRLMAVSRGEIVDTNAVETS